MMFEVEVKCGHVGRNYYITKFVPVEAENAKAAAAKARALPRVKHDHPDAVRQVRVVDAPRFAELIAVHKADPFFKCHSIQEQRRFCHDLVIHYEKRDEQFWGAKRESKSKLHFAGKEKIRNMKRYQRFYRTSEDDAA